MEHLKPPEHTAKCKSIGLYCISCQKPFLNDLALSVHKDTAHKLNTRRTDSPANTADNHELLQAQAEARREIGLYCADCNMTFRTKHKLQIHIRTTRHQPGTPIPASEPAPPAIHCNICSTEHVPGETTDSHEHSERHLNACKAHDLYCHECKSIFDSTAALNFHVCQPIPPKPSAPAQYPCPKCSQVFQKRELWTKHKRHCFYWIPCIACNVEIHSENVTNHKLSQEHINNSKLKGIYCHLCELSFMGVQGLHTHQVTSITHKQNLHKSGQSSEQGIVGEVSGGTKYCGICNANYVSSTKDHLHTQAHIDVCKEKDLYCTGCNLIFPTDRLRQIHVCSNQDPSRPNTFHCCDCDKSFPTNSQFIKHLKKGCHLKEGAFKCDPCNLAFSTRKQLNLHLNSNTHRTLKCLGSTECQRKFKNLAAMIQHLESGGCVSKLNRATIDGLVRSHDTAGAITIKDCPTPAMTLTGLNEYHFNGSSPPALNAPIDQSEGSDDGSIILTPATVLTPVSAQSRRNSTASTSAVLTSTISEFEFQLAKPQCNICGRTFASVTRLQMHIASPVHAVPIYHCPIDFLGELGLGGKEKNKKEKVFRTLSGLAQHIETGACRGGKQTWQKAIEFLEGKLAGFGLAGVKLLGQ